MQSSPKRDISFLKIHRRRVLWAKSTALPTTMLKHAVYPSADIILFWCVTLNCSYWNWTHCVSHINTWTVSLHISSINSVAILLSRLVKCLIMWEKQSILIRETDKWTEWPAPQERDSWGKSGESIFWAPFKKQNQCKPKDQSLQKELNKLKRQKLNGR